MHIVSFPVYEMSRVAVISGFSDGTVVKNASANAGDMRQGFDPWVRKVP